MARKNREDAAAGNDRTLERINDALADSVRIFTESQDSLGRQLAAMKTQVAHEARKIRLLQQGHEYLRTTSLDYTVEHVEKLVTVQMDRRIHVVQRFHGVRTISPDFPIHHLRNPVSLRTRGKTQRAHADPDPVTLLYQPVNLQVEQRRSASWIVLDFPDGFATRDPAVDYLDYEFSYESPSPVLDFPTKRDFTGFFTVRKLNRLRIEVEFPPELSPVDVSFAVVPIATPQVRESADDLVGLLHLKRGKDYELLESAVDGPRKLRLDVRESAFHFGLEYRLSWRALQE